MTPRALVWLGPLALAMPPAPPAANAAVPDWLAGAFICGALDGGTGSGEDSPAPGGGPKSCVHACHAGDNRRKGAGR